MGTGERQKHCVEYPSRHEKEPAERGNRKLFTADNSQIQSYEERNAFATLEKENNLPQFLSEEDLKQSLMTLDLGVLGVHIVNTEKPNVLTQSHHHQ